MLWNYWDVRLGFDRLSEEVPAMDEDIHHFMAVTGSSLEEARTMLEACAGNLDMAVNMHLECSGNRPEGAAQRLKTGEGSSRDVAASGNPNTYEEM